MQEIDVSLIKLHGVAAHSKISHGKRKIEQVDVVLERKRELIRNQVAEVINLTPEDITPTKNRMPDNISDLKQKADDFDHLVFLMKEKLKISNRRQKIQILTMAPRSWSIPKTAQEFSVSEYAVRQARKLAAEKGILELPERKRGKVLSANTKEIVVNFFNDDEYSREMPGMKDCVSVRRNVTEQKRLLLCNLKELYSLFKLQNPTLEVGFSTFCTLRPKWCVLLGRSGTHSVCVCTIHQNVDLMLSSVKLEKDRHQLMDMMVCDRESKKCMIHRCEKCPPTSVVEKYMAEQLQPQLQFENENSFIQEDEEIINFKLWTTVDRSDLVSHSLPVSDFITLLVEKLNKLTAHSYIAKSQAKFLKKCKSNLKENEVIVLGDFAENYKFVIQDEVQSYHWNQQSCTLHPLVIYQRQGETLKDHCLCFISDDLLHDTAFVYKVMSEAIEYCKLHISKDISHCYYFSDGCAGQYKNCKNFRNVCLHHEDFSIKCSWSFFATSHGKSPCDGLGGTVKRLAARASLQRVETGHILNANDLFTFCKENIAGIVSHFISKQEMDTVRKFLQQRFIEARTLPGTRSFHHFEPLSATVIAVKRVSEDVDYDMRYDLVLGKRVDTEIPEAAEVKASDFVLCSYDKEFWIGFVESVNKDEDDAFIKFMHPPYPARSYTWPTREDTCFVPLVNILCTISTPETVTSTGRQYKISEADVQKIEDEGKKLNN